MDKEKKKTVGNEWYVYVLKNRQGKHVYTGYTNNPQKRIEAHCKRRSGGARTTGRWGPDNAIMMILVGPFKDTPQGTAKQAALSFEKKMKLTKNPMSGLHGRVMALDRLLRSPDGKITKRVWLNNYGGEERLRIQTALNLETFINYCKTKTIPYPSMIYTQDSVRIEFDCQMPGIGFK